MNNKENKTKELYQKVVDGIENIIQSGEYEKFLKLGRNFHHYSFNNWVLIFSQMENATKVAGFKKWESMGRRLKKGSKGIMIMYPIKYIPIHCRKGDCYVSEIGSKHIVRWKWFFESDFSGGTFMEQLIRKCR